MIKIVLDLMGADLGPDKLIEGAINAINKNPDLFLYVCTKEELIKDVLPKYEYNKNQLEIIDCPEEITNNDIPTVAFKTKKQSSLVKGLELAKNDDIGGFCCCGSTGSVLVCSTFILGRIGKLRPALSPVLPGQKKSFALVDCGANSDCRAQQLVDFANMGVAYMQALGVENPNVALLSNGAEEKKGNDVVKEAHQLLKESNLNFIGNVEGKNLLTSDADVVVSDGFTGNIALKTIEGTAVAMFSDLFKMAKMAKTEVERDILLNAVYKLIDTYDFNKRGGAVLLGINKPVVKGHGAATHETVTSVCELTYTLAKNNMVEKIKKLVE